MDEDRLNRMKQVEEIEVGIQEPFGGPTLVGPPRLKEKSVALQPSEIEPEAKAIDFVDTKLFESQAAQVLLSFRKKLRENERLIDVALSDAENEEGLFSVDIKAIDEAIDALRTAFRGSL